MPRIEWKVRKKSGGNEFLRFRSFKEAARYYAGFNPPIKYVDGVPELRTLSDDRLKKRIKETAKVDKKKLKRIDESLTSVTVRISSKKGLTMRQIQNLINKHVPGAKARVDEVKHIQVNNIGQDMNRIRSAVDKIQQSVDRTTNEIY